MQLETLLKYEKDLWNRGIKYIAGVDEVGRGSLAGPMVVCAAIINKEHLTPLDNLAEEHTQYKDVRDSKLLTPNKRRALNDFLTNEVISYSIVEIPHSDIDSLGISKCTQIGFSKAVTKLDKTPHHIFTDTFEINDIAKHTQTNIKRGDTLSLSIAAASIIAKVYRDRLMINLHEDNEKYRVYGFDKHKGYGTAFHREMIKKHGHSDIHRISFKVK